MRRSRVVVDGHNDWLLLMERERSLGRTDSLRRRFAPQFRSAGIDVQVSPIYIDPEVSPEEALQRTLIFIRNLREEVDAGPDLAAICTTGAEIDAAVAADKLALVIALEGSHAVGTRIALFEALFELGLRMASFTHMSDTTLAGGSGDGEPGEGLSRFGLEALGLFERLGIVMDVSHLSVRSTEDVLEHATRPLVASHSSPKAVRDHHRNLTDEHVKGIADLGGVIGIPAAIPAFIDPENPTIDRVVDHIEHVAEQVGIDHVGIGADYVSELLEDTPDDEITFGDEDLWATIQGFESPADMPGLIAKLEERGFQGDELDKVLGGNLLRVFRAVMGVAG